MRPGSRPVQDTDQEKPSTSIMRLYLAGVLTALALLHVAFLFNVYDILKTLF